jgi:outer membrane protein TolC
VNLAAAVSQVLYDEADWASYRIQQHTYEGQTQQFIEFRLEVVQDVADAFLELDRNRALTRIQESNRELTARNLETTRARVATGYSSERELLRWQSQLAQNDQSVTQARTQALVNQFELNRARNRDREEGVEPLPMEVDAYGFVYAREAIVRAIAGPEADRKLRDLLVRIGVGRSPSIAAIDAAIAAEERLVTANERSFWLPSLTALAGVDHLADSGNASAGFDDFEETEWIARADLTFPLFEGGSKFSRLRQSREQLSGLRLAGAGPGGRRGLEPGGARASQRALAERGLRSSDQAIQRPVRAVACRPRAGSSAVCSR